MYIIMHIYLYFYMCVCRMRQGKKTSELQELLAETRKRLREGSSRSGMTAQDRAGLENKIDELEKTVVGLTKQIDEKGVAYIKKDGMFTMAARQAMSQLVTQQGTTFNSAYQDVVLSWQCMATQMGHTVAGLIAPDSKSAEIHAAVSSVAMSGRLVQFVRCWEMAAVVLGDRRETKGSDRNWCRDERPQDSLEGELGFMFSQESTEETSQDDLPAATITLPAATGAVTELASAGSQRSQKWNFHGHGL